MKASNVRRATENQRHQQPSTATGPAARRSGSLNHIQTVSPVVQSVLSRSMPLMDAGAQAHSRIREAWFPRAGTLASCFVCHFAEGAWLARPYRSKHPGSRHLLIRFSSFRRNRMRPPQHPNSSNTRPVRAGVGTGIAGESGDGKREPFFGPISSCQTTRTVRFGRSGDWSRFRNSTRRIISCVAKRFPRSPSGPDC